MKTIFKTLYILAIAATATSASAQTLNSAYFTDDFKFRHEMNPAYANEQTYVSIPVLGNVNVSTRGDFGVKDVIMTNPMYPSNSSDRLTTFMNPYISAADALKGFKSGDNKFTQELNITLLSAGFKGFGGYNTIELNVREALGLSLPYELFEFAKNIGNRTYNVGDIDMSAQAYAELAFGHSRQIDEKLRVGAKVKLLFAGARADMAFRDIKADLAGTDKWTLSGQAEANVSMKGFMYKTEQKEYNEEGKGTYTQINDVDVDGAGLGGFGMAFDLGAVYKLNEDWTFSAALLDLGFISWTNNMTAVNNGEQFVFDGFHDVAVTSGRNGDKLSTHTDRLSDQFMDFAHLTDKGDQGGRTTGIGATLNIGAEYTLPVYRKIKFGALSSTRIRGQYTWTEGRVSANWSPLKWLDGGVNFAANNYGASMGWVLNIHPKAVNFFIGMDHLLPSLSKDGIPLGSNTSVALGMNVAW